MNNRMAMKKEKKGKDHAEILPRKLKVELIKVSG